MTHITRTFLAMFVIISFVEVQSDVFTFTKGVACSQRNVGRFCVFFHRSTPPLSHLKTNLPTVCPCILSCTMLVFDLVFGFRVWLIFYKWFDKSMCHQLLHYYNTKFHAMIFYLALFFYSIQNKNRWDENVLVMYLVMPISPIPILHLLNGIKSAFSQMEIYLNSKWNMG